MKKILYIFVTALLLTVFGTSAYAQKPNGNPGISNVINPCQLFVPNAFTPNGDNINERFTIKYNGECTMVLFEMHIFDRWGRLVYEINDPDPNKAWDGTTDGIELKEGVYMWKVNCKLVDPAKPAEAQLSSKQGTVVLLR